MLYRAFKISSLPYHLTSQKDNYRLENSLIVQANIQMFVTIVERHLLIIHFRGVFYLYALKDLSYYQISIRSKDVQL